MIALAKTLVNVVPWIATNWQKSVPLNELVRPFNLVLAFQTSVRTANNVWAIRREKDFCARKLSVGMTRLGITAVSPRVTHATPKQKTMNAVTFLEFQHVIKEQTNAFFMLNCINTRYICVIYIYFVRVQPGITYLKRNGISLFSGVFYLELHTFS